MAATLGRLWDSAVTLLAAQSQLQSDTSNIPAVERAVEIGGPPYTNVKGIPCVLPLVTHEFGNSYYHPAVETFNAPPCDEEYSIAYLKWAASCDAGVQYDRVAAVWVNGVELLRTSTAEPSREFRVEWEVVKDISLYGDIFKTGGTVVVALDNIVNSIYTSTFKVDLSLEFYRPLDLSKEVKRPDQIVPVSSSDKSYGWFSEKPTAGRAGPPHQTVQLPDNTEELYLELFLSHHQCDEFYYSNPPDNFAAAFAERLGKRTRGDVGETANNSASCGTGGAFREVQVRVDDKVVGVVWPFPLVFTGGLSPYLWKPIVSIGAFDAPTYIVNLTPFLGNFLGSKPHAVAFRVVYGEAFWLIDGNLLVFQDTEAARPTRVHVLKEHLDRYVEPAVVTLPSMVGDGHGNGNATNSNSAFWMSVERNIYVKTSVTTSAGRKVYTLQQHFEFTNTQMYSSDGLDQWFESHTHVETKMAVTSLAVSHPGDDPSQSDDPAKVQTVYISQVEDYPLAGSVSYRLGRNGSFVLVTQFANSFSRSTTVEGNGTGHRFDYRPHDVHSALTASAMLDSRHGGGNGSTRVTYASASPTEGCFSQEVAAEFGRLTVDNSTTECDAYK